MIACCGLDCEKCDAFIATATDDQAKRGEVAADWSKRYHANLSAADINCTGCQGRGVKFAYCEHMCQIRACAKTKGLINCAGCAEYGCTKLQPVFQAAPQAKAALDAQRQP
jgi:hypothetical protein